MDEVGVYTIKNGKIAEERFFYGCGGRRRAILGADAFVRPAACRRRR